MDLHGHSTLHNIHMDTNMDMDTEYGSTSTLHNIHMDTDMNMNTEYGFTWSVETLYIPKYPFTICAQIKTGMYDAISSLALK